MDIEKINLLIGEKICNITFCQHSLIIIAIIHMSFSNARYSISLFYFNVFGTPRCVVV